MLIATMPILLANCSLLLGPYFAQNFASKFGQGLLVSRPSHLQYLITYSMQIWRGKTWEFGHVRLCQVDRG